jgi:hypothetical protein
MNSVSFNSSSQKISDKKSKFSLVPAKPKLLDQLREALRSRHYSHRTEQTYCSWVKRFIYFHNVRHPREMAEPEINDFLTHLAVKEKVSASTQNQALSALLCSFTAKRLPVVMIRDEVKAMLANLTGDKWMMASMM